MPFSAQLRDFVLEQLQSLGRISSKSMFGGVGLYYNTLFFAILYNDTLYLKVDDSNRGDYGAEDMQPFKPYKNKPATLQYYEVPAHVLESRELLAEWARKAINAAKNARPKRRMQKSSIRQNAQDKKH
ncbi:MAG: TfoX/Sxy family protein [bacterium]